MPSPGPWSPTAWPPAPTTTAPSARSTRGKASSTNGPKDGYRPTPAAPGWPTWSPAPKPGIPTKYPASQRGQSSTATPTTSAGSGNDWRRGCGPDAPGKRRRNSVGRWSRQLRLPERADWRQRSYPEPTDGESASTPTGGTHSPAQWHAGPPPSRLTEQRLEGAPNTCQKRLDAR
jgi:hypothetical protein